MKHTFKILTRKKDSQSHRETEITIDWSGVSVDDLKILAKNAIVQDLQARIRHGEFDTFPVKVEIIARNVVHHESAALWEFKALPPKEKKVDPVLEALLKNLTADEIKALMH